ncbi:hypothetical protein SO802_027695 [Lithocarpus litseifolius]|uniref:Endonuclease/exonuclease/phosphatase domain-containing protein n=1 Tax=Lithocarpus litseifolius TaxID=425828 RepID=A0AAW2C6L4_9ROSI
MRLLSWNCQGLGNPWTGRSLRKIVREQDPTVCFLMETRLDKDGFQTLYGNLPYQNKIVVKHPDSGGGLAFLWKNSITLETFVEGPWLVVGDFNSFLHASEKKSKRPPQYSQVDAFRTALESCQLQDLGFKGYPFTWNNRRPGEANTKIRLDRAVANNDWIGKFQMSKVLHLSTHASDHLPILLQVQSFVPQRRERRFKFKEAWLLMEECEVTVKEAWNSGLVGEQGLASILKKIQVCGSDLMKWGLARMADEEVKLEVHYGGTFL